MKTNYPELKGVGRERRKTVIAGTHVLLNFLRQHIKVFGKHSIPRPDFLR